MTPSVLTVMFTDLVGSVRLYSKVSDSTAVALCKEIDRRVRGILPGFDGTFVKSTGDGQLLTFPDPRTAARCTDEIHGMCDVLGTEQQQPLLVRIAAHSGEAIRGDEDVHGNTVNLAARVLSIAEAGETCLTGEAWSGLPEEGRQDYVAHGPEIFKGFTRFSRVFRKPPSAPARESTFRPPSTGRHDTSMRLAETMPRHSNYTLAVDHPQVRKTILVREGETHVLGRAPDCATVVPDRMFSGAHAAFAVVEGILWAFDLHSANGIRFKGRPIKRRRPIEAGSTVQLPAGTVRIALP